jgi:peptidoglycan/LPS O-acetylase OafA/YrhL
MEADVTCRDQVVPLSSYHQEGKYMSRHHVKAEGVPMPRNGLIDGWRGISIAFVLIGHILLMRHPELTSMKPLRHIFLEPIDWFAVFSNLATRILAPMAITGVKLFFIISGYLITSLLLREEATTDRISLSAFYVRRIFRIIPAFAVFLVVTLILSHYGIVPIPKEKFIYAAAFLCNATDCSYGLSHIWTLSIEEQFYLMWPLVFGFLAVHRRTLWLTTALFLLLPLAFFRFLAVEWVNNPLYFSCIALGCLYAVSNGFRAAISWAAAPWTIGASMLVLVAFPFASSWPLFQSWLEVLSPLCIALIFFASFRSGSGVGTLVSAVWLQRLGLGSYSLYLWQQIFTFPLDIGPQTEFMRYTALILMFAGASYYLIERPFIKFGHQVSRAIQRRQLARIALAQQTVQ